MGLAAADGNETNKKRTKMEKLLQNKKPDANEGDAENFYSNDPSKLKSNIIMDIDKLDLINNLNSIKLLAVSEAFEAYPNMRVDCDQFVKIMKQVLEDSGLSRKEDFV